MSVETQAVAVLKTVSANVYPTIAPQVTGSTLPRITYQLVAGFDEPSYDADGSGASKRRIQIDFWAGDYGTARRLADQARAALYAGMTVGQITDNPSDYEADTKLHRASFDIEAWE